MRVAFSFSTAGGLIFAKTMNLFLKQKINPLLGSAGVSAVPMAARVSHKMGNEANPKCYILMHAMGPNVAGVIGTVIVAGILITLAKAPVESPENPGHEMTEVAPSAADEAAPLPDRRSKGSPTVESTPTAPTPDDNPAAGGDAPTAGENAPTAATGEDPPAAGEEVPASD